MADSDVLDRLLDVAQSESALGPEQIAHFAEGLRERARLVLQERGQLLEQKVQVCEATLATLQKENAWLRDSVAALEAQVGWLKDEAGNWRAARDQATAALEQAQAAHDRLLAHHREVVSRAAHGFSAAASLPFWKFRECRAQLAEAAALFERERV